MLGPMSGPALPQQSLLTDVGSAIGAFPAAQQQAQQTQADTDMKNMQAAAQRLNVLNQMTAANPNTASDPNIISAYDRAYKFMGMPTPVTSDGGTKKIDINAAGAYHGIQSFIAQNLPMLQQMDPGDRSAAIEAATGTAPPQQLVDTLNKLPRKYLQSPAEAGQLLNYVKTSVASLGKPGGSIDNVISSITSVAKPLSEIGLDSDALVSQLKPDLYAAAMSQAQLNLINAKTADEQAKAKSALELLPQKIAQIKTTDDLKTVMMSYYPAMAAAATSRAASDAALVGPKIDNLRAQTAKDFAEADKAHNEATQLLGTANLAAKFGVKNQSSYSIRCRRARTKQRSATTRCRRRTILRYRTRNFSTVSHMVCKLRLPLRNIRSRW